MSRVVRSCALAVLCVLGVGLIVASGGTSSDGAATFSKSFGGELFDNVATAIPTADGGYLFVGNRDATTPNDERYYSDGPSGNAVWAVKLDALGDISWEKLIGDAGLNSGAEGASRTYRRVVAAADGGAWLIGTERPQDGVTADLVVSRLGDSGQLLWTRVYDSSMVPPDSYFYPSGNTQEEPGTALETAEGHLWIVARGTAYVRDPFVDNGNGNNAPVGVMLGSTYLLRLNTDGSVLTSRHMNVRPADQLFMPRSVHLLPDGGLEFVSQEEDYNFVFITDPAGTVRSKTAIPEQFRLSFYGLFTATPVEAVIPMRRNGIAGDAGDDGFVVVGRSDDDSVIARYSSGERDPDDPTEGAGNGEFLPRENQWTIEIPESSQIWAAAARCGPAPVVNRRCGIIVAGKGREAAGDLLLANIDVDGNISGLLRKVTGIDRACAMQPLAGLTDDGRVAYRILVRATDGRGGSLVVDDLLAVRQPFTAGAGPACVDDYGSSDLIPGGDWVAVQRNTAAGTIDVSRTRGDATARWQQSFAFNGKSWVHALSVRQTDDNADGALDDGFLVAAEAGSSADPAVSSALLMKLDRNGTVEWQRSLPGLAITDAGARVTSDVLAVQSDRYLLVVHDASGGSRALGLDRSGAVLWQRGLWDAGARGARSAVALRDGGWLIGSGGPVRGGSVALSRLTGGGAVSWSRGFSAISGIDSLAETPGGELVMGGADRGTAVFGKLDASGNPLWTRRIDSRGEYIGVANPLRLGVTPSGDILVAVNVQAYDSPALPEEEVGPENGRDLILHRYSAGGVQQWTRRYGGRYHDDLASLQVTSDGGAILGLKSSSLGDRNDRSEGWVIRVAPDGAVAPGCAAELLGMNFPDVRVHVLEANSTALDPGTIGARDDVALPVTARSSLQPYPSFSPTVIARHCSGSVPRSRAGGGPVAHLRVIQGGSVSGVVSSVPAGILCGTSGGGDCEENFDEGLLVTLNVDSGSRSMFESWSGCDQVDGTQCLVRMSSDRTVVATFSSTPRSPNVGLTLNTIVGRGTVTGPGGISCRATNTGNCTTTLTRGSTAQLVATPDASRSFLGWDGSCAAFGNTRAITFVMNDPFLCGARFSGPPPGAPVLNVQVNPDQGGDVISDPAGIDCGAANSLCSEGFAVGTNITLTARATQPGYEFDSFICQGVGRTYERNITLENLTQDRSCEANFSPGIERLYLRVVRDIGDTATYSHVYVEGGGLDCVYDCDRPFERGRTLILRAEPWSDYVLSAWSGCQGVYPDNTHVGANYYCLVNLDQRRDVVAFFSRVQIGSPNGLRSLAVNFAPGSAPGQVTSNPGFIECRRDDGVCATTFNAGQVVNLDLEPLAGSTLATHEGCDTFTPAGGGQPARCRVTMSADRVLTVGFTRPNNPPVAAFTFEPTAPLIGQPVTFNAGSSSDDNGIAGYAWSFTDNGVINATSSVTSRTYTAAGTYTVRLTVTDGDGVSDDEVQTIVVSNPGVVLPVITLQPGSVTVSPGATATFTVSANPGGGTLSYRWQRNGTDIPGATSESHTTPATTTADDGAVFRVVLSNSAGSVVSNSAVLTVGHGWRPVGNALATPAFNPSLAMNSGGDIHVSHTAPLSGLQTLYVRRFNGTTWSIVGDGPVDPASTYSISEHMLITAADGYPIVAWNQGPAARVAHWNGTQWDFIGNDLSIDTTDNFGTSDMQIARHGNDLVAAWTETFGFPSTAQRVAVQRYSAATGTWTGGYLPNVSYVGEIRLALDSTGLAAVAYVPRPLSGGVGAIQVMRESAAGWAPLGGDVGPVPVANSNGLVANYGIDIHFDSNDEPVVIGSADSYNIFAFRHSGSAWLPLGLANGVLVALDPATDTTSLMALVRREGYIAMAYTHSHRQANGGTQFLTEFLRWNGSAWEPIGDALSLLNYTLSPELDGGLNPIMAGEHRPPGGFSEVVVRRYVP